jgi:hypothetical protein
MSKDIVLNNSSQEIALIELKRKGQKELVSKAAVESWLEAASSGKELMKSVLYMNSDNHLHGATIAHRSAKLSAPSGQPHMNRYESVLPPALAVCIIPGWTLNGLFIGPQLFSHFPELGSDNGLTALTIISLFIGPPFLATVGWLPFFPAYRRKYERAWNRLLAVQSEGMRGWLKSRHGVEVGDKTLKALADTVLRGINQMEFMDVEQRSWVLQCNEAFQYQLERADDSESHKADFTAVEVKPQSVLAVSTAKFGGEIAILGERVDTRIAQLRQFPLTSTQSASVQAAVEDAHATVAGFERLQALGAGEAAEGHLLDVLRLLDAEIESIVQAKVTEETAALFARKERAVTRHDEVGV